MSTLTQEIRIKPAPESESVDQKLARLVPFAIWENEAMNSDDCQQALNDILRHDNWELSNLESGQLMMLAEACTAYNWHVISGALRGMADTRRVIGLP